MKVNHVLILAAGRGTRMGAIGKKLPKVMWPVFEKTLLELQVEFARELAFDADIYINLFHEKEFIKENLKVDNVSLIEEKERLDIGGAVHNLAKKLSYKGNLLILNSDQFLCFNKEVLEQGLSDLNEFDSMLFSFLINSNDKYNSLCLKNDLLKGIVQNGDLPRDTIHETYTGVSLINLERLSPEPGESKFFDTVANYKNLRVGVRCIKDLEYWDFGTVARYVDSIQKVLALPDSRMCHFLKRNKAIDSQKIQGVNYNGHDGINMDKAYISQCEGSIILSKMQRDDIPKKSLVYGDLSESIADLLKKS